MPDPTPIDPAATHEIASHKHDRPLVSCAWDPLGRFVLFGSEDSARLTGLAQTNLREERIAVQPC